MDEVKQGVVKWFNEKKGFGFVVKDNVDYFVHYKEIIGEGFKTLDENDRVEFEEATSPKGKVARKVRVIV